MLLEFNIGAELNPALLVLAAGSAERCAIGDAGIRCIQIRMVEQIEDFNTEFHPDLLVDRREFVQGSIRLEESVTAEEVFALVALGPDSGLSELRCPVGEDASRSASV